MLTSDREVNRDFDVNNLFLNLDFQHQEETFEYKWPLLDHPSNYQLIVTKLLTRTSLPYIKLHETKKQINQAVNPGEPFYYDYQMKLYFDEINEPSVNEFKDELSSYKNTVRCENLSRCNYTTFTFFGKCFAERKEKEKLDINKLYNYIDAAELEDLQQPFVWFDSGEHRNIYTLEQVFHIINNTLTNIFNAVTQRYLESYKKQIGKIKGYEDNFYKKKVVIFKKALPICIALEDNVPVLFILDEMLECMVIDAKSSETKENPIRRMVLQISKNLFKFLKGLHFVPSIEFNGEFYQFVITKNEYLNAESRSAYIKVENIDEEIEITYRIFRGEQLNIMELSDYIGLAITTPDFPIKEQIYPQFHYDFEGNLFRENRRRYVPFSESCIIDTIFNDTEKWQFKKENVNELTKYSTGDKILFVKYFDAIREDMNAICYENNNSTTALKMDLMNVMPLKKFTLKLYLIDRYNNFEPLYPKIEGHDDVIKLQLLFTRIKGTEKENRNIIETKKEAPERYIIGLEELDDDNEEENENNEPENEIEPEITNEPEILPDIKLVSVPAITKDNDEILPDINVIPVPAINTEKEQDSDEEDDIEAPPEKRIYLENENEDSENENELY